MERLKRLKIYFDEMLPLQQSMSGLVLALAYFMSLSKLNLQPLEWNLYLSLGAIGLCLFLILIRIMDEYKDYEDDLQNYPDRPLPSGRVLFSDLKFLSYFIVAGLIIVNSFAWPMAIAGAVVFGFSVLMLKWFFMEEKIRASLPLALFSHHPVIYLCFVYLFACYSVSNPGVSMVSLLMLIPFSTIFTNWEISRKIRAPKDEDTYTTYSQVLGLNGAILTALGRQSVVVGGMLIYFSVVGSPIWFSAAFLTIALGIAGFYLHFMKTNRPQKGTSVKRPLRPFAEALGVLVQGSVIIEYLLF